MATFAHSTPAPELVSFEDAAATEWEPNPLNLEALSFPGDTLNNPHMVHVRAAAVMLAKTKFELMEVVRRLDGLHEDGGELSVLVAGMEATQDLFRGFADMLRCADARLFAATCAAVLAEDAA